MYHRRNLSTELITVEVKGTDHEVLPASDLKMHPRFAVRKCREQIATDKHFVDEGRPAMLVEIDRPLLTVRGVYDVFTIFFPCIRILVSSPVNSCWWKSFLSKSCEFALNTFGMMPRLSALDSTVTGWKGQVGDCWLGTCTCVFIRWVEVSTAKAPVELRSPGDLQSPSRTTPTDPSPGITSTNWLRSPATGWKSS